MLVDFDTDDGLDLLHRLVTVADVIVFNQPAHVLARWSCADDDIESRNPRAVIVHVSAFGATGPHADRSGNGSLAEAFVGLGIGTAPIGDTMAAATGVIGVLAALYWRDARGGRGQVVDVSLYESLLPLLAPAVAGLASGSVGSHREIVAANDGRSIMISATTRAQIERLRDLTGADDVAAWVAERSASDAVTALVAARVPAVAVNDIASLIAEPHVVARNSITTVDGTTIPAPTPRLSATPGSITHLGPALGDDTAAVVTEWLGGGTA
jgi:formyl-CoA transferase